MRPLATIAILAALLAPTTGHAKKSDSFRHRYEEVWRAAVRLIRVDQGYPIRDRDESVGYLLFDYKDDGRTYPGSVELMQIKDQEGSAVRVAIQIPAMPGYIERMLLDKLEKKLFDEYGEPERPAKPEPKPDDNPDDSGDE